MEKVKRILRRWLPLVVVVIGLCALVYLAVQQELRQSANDPQIQMAQDASSALEIGAAAESILPGDRVAIESSLAPFVMVFSDNGEVVGSSGFLHGGTPTLPAGVLEYVRGHGEDRVTWQPEAGVRIAAVVVRYGGAAPGFVLAGRSLREVEIREDNALLAAGAACVFILIASLAAVAFGEIVLGETAKKHD